MERPLDGGQLPRGVAQGGRGLRFGKIDTRIRVARLTERRISATVASASLPWPPDCLRRGQEQAVFDVVREEAPERAVHVDRLRRIPLRFVEPAFDFEPILARQHSGSVKRLLRRLARPSVVTKRRPRRRERGLNQRVCRLDRCRLVEQRLRFDCVEQAKPSQALGVKPHRLDLLRERGGGAGRCLRRALLQPEPASQLAPGVRHHRKEMRLVTHAGDTDNVIRLAQDTHVDTKGPQRRPRRS